MKLKNKKELKEFIDNRTEYIDYLIIELNNYKICGVNRSDYQDRIDEIQEFYENEFLKKDTNVQIKLRLGFWAFFSELVMDKLGGELIIAPPSDYAAGTPQLINYGNKYNKKGKRKWIGISFDSWLESHLLKKNNFTLGEKVKMLIDDYS
jgi:hypothetical protein